MARNQMSPLGHRSSAASRGLRGPRLVLIASACSWGCGGAELDDDLELGQGEASLHVSAGSWVTEVVLPAAVEPLSAAAASTTPGTDMPTGTTALAASHPWVVTVSGSIKCNGVLINPSWVLTAAHCIGSVAGTVSYSRRDATTGTVSGDSRPFNVNGPKRGMFVHPDFELDSGFGQPYNDIALVQVAEPFTIDASLQTAALPRSPANPGRVGTIVTHDYVGNLPAGHIATVRTPQLGPDECATPAGFLCISPPVNSLCKGDSGSGFTMTLDGRATVIGIASNIDGSTECISAGRQAQLVDVYAYRDWILDTIGMNQEELAGHVRLRWTGVPSNGTMSLQCLPGGVLVDVRMNVPGGEIAVDCDDAHARVFCLPEGANLAMAGFRRRTISPDGSTTEQELPYAPSWTAALADFSPSFQQFTCSVSDGVTSPVSGTATVAR